MHPSACARTDGDKFINYFTLLNNESAPLTILLKKKFSLYKCSFGKKC